MDSKFFLERSVNYSRPITTLRTRGVHISAELDLKCTTKTKQIEIGSNGTSHLKRGLGSHMVYFLFAVKFTVPSSSSISATFKAFDTISAGYLLIANNLMAFLVDE